MANMFEKYDVYYESEQKKLKMMAMEQDKTIAALIHGWIAEHSEEVDE